MSRDDMNGIRDAFLKKLGVLPPQASEFTASRWPYTYAWDYVRCHRTGALLSRSEVSVAAGVFTEDEDAKRRLACDLAALYCAEHGIAIPEGSR